MAQRVGLLNHTGFMKSFAGTPIDMLSVTNENYKNPNYLENSPILLPQLFNFGTVQPI